MENCELLSEISIDDYKFKVTWSPVLKDSCILWFRDNRLTDQHEPLGRFSNYNQRRVLDFIARYCTSATLREHIDGRKFESRLNAFQESFFERVPYMSEREKMQAFKYIYDLDDEIEPRELSTKRRIMAKKFHPDCGGSTAAMSVINEAYNLLSSHAKDPLGCPRG
jgi:hypothetical protein